MISAAVCCVPVSPLRSTPSHRAEMVSQLLFGDQCTILESAPDNWTKVRCDHDQYEGWCQQGQLTTLRESLPATSYLTQQWVTGIKVDGKNMQVPLGCSIPGLKDKETVWGDMTVSCNEDLYTLTNRSSDESLLNNKSRDASIDENLLKQIAFKFLNTGYLWGGRSVFGVDCSGFCQVVYKFLGISLMRDAYQQATQGEVVGFLQEARVGDLAFFDNDEGRITHVGILLNDSEIIHSSVKVRIDRIDNMGIINSDTKLRTHKLRLIKRIIV